MLCHLADPRHISPPITTPPTLWYRFTLADVSSDGTTDSLLNYASGQYDLTIQQHTTGTTIINTPTGNIKIGYPEIGNTIITSPRSSDGTYPRCTVYTLAPTYRFGSQCYACNHISNPLAQNGLQMLAAQTISIPSVGFTVCFWFWNNALNYASPSGSIIWNLGGTSKAFVRGLGSLWYFNNNHAYDFSPNIQTKTWTYVSTVIKKEGTYCRVIYYLNGVEKLSVLGTTLYPTGSFVISSNALIGATDAALSDYTFLYSDYRYYPYILSQPQIESIYKLCN
jgi:hypothetical protein